MTTATTPPEAKTPAGTTPPAESGPAPAPAATAEGPRPAGGSAPAEPGAGGEGTHTSAVTQVARPSAAEPAESRSRAAVAAARAAAVLEPGLDQPVRLIGARLWVAGVALLLAVGAGAGWAAFGSLPHTLTVNAVVAHGPAPVQVAADRAGALFETRVRPGDRVAAGQTVAVVRTAGEGDVEVRAAAPGTVTALLAAPGAQLAPGSPVVALDPSDAPAVVRLVATSAKDAARLAPGRAVLVPLPGGGVVRAVVTAADPLPVAAGSLAGTLPVAPPGLPAGDTPVWLAYARLPDGTTVSAPFTLPVKVDLGARHPYQAVLNKEPRR
ncbi:hypothetical protein [Kitasatospora terrestris]|uniref:Membrane fusion protein biotin-lipoyl like domain-containing protein n=1 Tax=Kitasatospora terrestris TaxID=258051 RepID=A0ABP9DK99_9ACTN